MSAEAPDSIPPPAGHRPVVKTKLTAPLSGRHIIPRPRLLQQLHSNTWYRLRLITAPAGYGKTTLLRDWSADFAGRVAWITLDDYDNDPGHFWSTFMVAIAAQVPPLRAACEQLARSLHPKQSEEVLTRLINLLTVLPIPLFLALDDYQVITNTAIHAGMAFLLDHVPPQFCIVLASRTQPPLPLARWRMHGELLAVDRRALRFSAAEVATLLCEQLGIALTPPQIAQITARTEGWIAALQLVGISLGEGRDIERFLSHFAGTHHELVDYLCEDVLAHEDEPTQHFLLQLGVLGRISPALAQAVTGRTDARDCLAAIERANLFLQPLDDDRQWYRFHALFAEFLRSQLEQQHPDWIAALRRAAALWFEQQSLYAEAVDQALAINDVACLQRLIGRAAQDLVSHGEMLTLLRWLSHLPATMRATHPQFLLMEAGTKIAIGQLDAAEADTNRAEELIRREMAGTCAPAERVPTESVSGTLAEVYTTRAVLAGYRGDVPKANAYMAAALPLLPPENVLLRCVTLAGMAAAHWWSGDIDAASSAFAAARQLSERAQMGHISVACFAGEGFVQMARGNLPAALATFRTAQQMAHDWDSRELQVVALALSGEGAILREWNRLDEAEVVLRRSIADDNHYGDLSVFVSSSLHLMRIDYARGDVTHARELLIATEQELQRKGGSHLLGLVAASRIWLDLGSGDMVAARQWAQQQHGNSSEPQTALSEAVMLLAVRVDIATGAQARALQTLDGLGRDAEQHGRSASLIEITLLRACALHGSGATALALDALTLVLQRAAPGKYLRLFLDEGPALHDLLVLACSRPACAREAQRILAQRQTPDDPIELVRLSTVMTLSDPLNAREAHLLRLLTAGRSNREMADELVLAPNTIKWHMRHLYAKLQVHSRGQAVARARALGLIV